jgi:hypothetical protein
VDRDARRDRKITGSFFVILSVLGCLGLALLLFSLIVDGVQAGSSSDRAGAAILIGTCILCGALLVTTIYMGLVLIKPERNPRLFSSLRWLGPLGIGCLTLAAAIIVFFLGCAAAVLQDLSGIGR